MRRFAAAAILALLLGASIPPLFLWFGSGRLPALPDQPPTLPETAEESPPGQHPTQVSNNFQAFRSYRELVSFLERARQSLSAESQINEVFSLPWIAARATTIPAEVVRTFHEGSRVSKTNVQVEGIDEMDIVKTNGSLILLGQRDLVYVIDVKKREVAGTLRFRGEQIRGVLLHSDKLIVVSTRVVMERTHEVDEEGQRISFRSYGPKVVVRAISLGSLKVAAELQVSGDLLGARMKEGIAYLVINQPAVELMGVFLPFVNDRPIEPSRISNLSARPVSYVTLLALNSSDLSYNVISFLASRGSYVYMSQERLYVMSPITPDFGRALLIAYSALTDLLPGDIGERVAQELRDGDFGEVDRLLREYVSRLSEQEVARLSGRLSQVAKSVELSETTVVNAFEVKGLQAKALGSVGVPGRLLDQFAVEEHREHLLIATTDYKIKVAVHIVSPIRKVVPGESTKVVECVEGSCRVTYYRIPPRQETEPPLLLVRFVTEETDNRVYSISLPDLKVAGEIEGLAPGERIYSARLVKDTLFLVTFREVDPLFAIDVSEPAKPKVLGYLKIPGFSEYLHPLAGDLLLGIGVENGSLKVSLFDVRDPKEMKERTKLLVEGAWSPALQDHHAVTFDPDHNYVYLPAVLRGGEGALLVISHGGGKLSMRAVLQHLGVMRSLYVGNELFSVSDSSVKVYDLRDMSQLAEIRLQEPAK
ncbi:MAG: beta-propeller domain-containing protein [Acidilobaceae archaeon]